LEFDVTLTYTPVEDDYSIIRFQNGIQSIFEKFRLSYGSTNLEEIEHYNKLARLITTHTGPGQTGGMDQMSISDGVAGAAWGSTGTYSSTSNTQVHPGMVNGRQAFIQGISLQKGDVDTTGTINTGTFVDIISKNQWASYGFGGIPFGVSGEGTAATEITVTRRYSVPILSGMMQQSKLIPLKFMAQLQAVFNLARPENCIFWQKPYSVVNGVVTMKTTTSCGKVILFSLRTFEVLKISIPAELNLKRLSLKKITQRIVDENFIGNDYFRFYLTKKGKTKEDSLQLENV
jgi:hypothetical protein